MKTLPSWLLLLCFGLASPALAQHRPGPPPVPGTPSARELSPRTPPADAGGGATVQPMPTCEEVRRSARYGISFDKVDIEKLVHTVSDATCRTFILPENVRRKISIISPENGKAEVDADQFFAVFVAALDANGLVLYQHGKPPMLGCNLPTVKEDGADTTNEQMVTQLFRIKNGEVEPLLGVLQQMVRSKDSDTIPLPPDLLIINDVESNMRRLERLIQQLDTRAASDEVRIIQVVYASAQDVATALQQLFEAKPDQGRSQCEGAPAVMPMQNNMLMPEGAPMPTPERGAAGGPVTFSQLIPDERTNKLIVVASPAAIERIEAMERQLDISTSGTEGR